MRPRRKRTTGATRPFRFRRMTGQAGGYWLASATWGVRIHRFDPRESLYSFFKISCAASGPSAVSPISGNAS